MAYCALHGNTTGAAVFLLDDRKASFITGHISRAALEQPDFCPIGRSVAITPLIA